MPLENTTRCQCVIPPKKTCNPKPKMWNLIVTPIGPMWNQIMSISLNTRASILDIQNHKQWDLRLNLAKTTHHIFDYLKCRPDKSCKEH